MIRYGVIATILLLVTAAVVATFRDSEIVVGTDGELATRPIQQADLQERLALLETIVRDEQQLRKAMEQRVSELVIQNQRLSEQVLSVQRSEGDGAVFQDSGERFVERRVPAALDQPDRTEQRLIAAGFDEYQAADILRMTEEFQMRLLNARFEAEQTGERIDFPSLQAEVSLEMKNVLGEADYEKYLEAIRRPTSVAIRNVLASSPAETAGLQSGDEIVRYGGERVYNIGELNRLTSSPSGSGTVLVEVIRDGQTITLSLPEGPIGITSRSRGGF